MPGMTVHGPHTHREALLRQLVIEPARDQLVD
jgi:hypothetical protein